MQTIHVCLVSEQTIPNILAIEHFKPDKLLLISTEKMENQGKSGHILDSLALMGLDYHDRKTMLKVREDSMPDIHLKLDQWIARHEESDLTVNLTGGTKIMSIATLEFFKNYGCRIIYVPIPRNEYITLFPKRRELKRDALPKRLSVPEYLAAYGLTLLNAHRLNDMANQARQRKELARWIAVNYPKVKGMLGRIGKSLRIHRNDKEYAFEMSFVEDATAEEIKLLSKAGLSLIDGRLAKRLSKSEIQFLTGGWLEEYCFNEVCALQKSEVDDAALGVQIRNAKGASNEFDIMFTKDNALYTVECKSLDQDEDRKVDVLYKIAALQKDFGLRVKSFLISTSPHILKEGQVQDFISARAEHLNTTIITPNKVPDFRQYLVEQLPSNK